MTVLTAAEQLATARAEVNRLEGVVASELPALPKGWKRDSDGDPRRYSAGVRLDVWPHDICGRFDDVTIPKTQAASFSEAETCRALERAVVERCRKIIAEFGDD